MAEETARAVTRRERPDNGWAQVWDKILTGRKTALPVMLLGLFFLLWLTIAGANVPSEWLWQGVLWCYGRLSALLAGTPWFVRGALCLLYTSSRLS